MRLTLFTALFLTAPTIFAQSAIDVLSELSAMTAALQNQDPRTALQHALAVQAYAFTQPWPESAPKFFAPDVTFPGATSAAVANQIQKSLAAGDTFLTKIYSEALPVILTSELNRTSPAPRPPGDMKDLIQRISVLPGLAGAAFDANDMPTASSDAGELMTLASKSISQYKGDALFYANVIAGRIALQSGDIASARAFLLSAGRTEGSPVLKSFGPDMSLALDLLNKGERDTVIAYLAACKKFWTSPNTLDRWIADVQQGKTPDFRFNLKLGLTPPRT